MSDQSDLDSHEELDNPPDKLNAADDEALVSAVGEMNLLLSHAISANIVVPPERLKILIETKRALRRGEVDSELEIAFWGAFLELGQQLHPISVESLKATNEQYSKEISYRWFSRKPKRTSHAGITVDRYQLLSIIALVVLLSVQIYTLFGASTVKGIELFETDIATARLKIDDLYSQLSATVSGDDSGISKQIRETETNINQMTDNLLAHYSTLRIWYLFGAVSEETEDIVLLRLAKLTFESLSTYILPLLYGFLGACVFVVRTLSQEIRDLTYTANANIRYQLRIYLGALAGLAIGWFITEGTAPTILESITPIALAFLAGYGVELLFSAMDAIISTFSRGKDAPREH